LTRTIGGGRRNRLFPVSDEVFEMLGVNGDGGARRLGVVGDGTAEGSNCFNFKDLLGGLPKEGDNNDSHLARALFAVLDTTETLLAPVGVDGRV